MLEDDINLFLNDFMNHQIKRNSLIFNNLDIFLELCYFLDNEKSFYESTEEFSFDITKSTQMSFLDKIQLISDFYKEMNIDISVEDLVNKGILDIQTPFKEEINAHCLTYGSNNYIDHFKTIKIFNNNLLTDSIIWVHEISHYRNQPNNERSEVNDLLTESLAFAEQFIYMDYLDKKGYSNETKGFKCLELDAFNSILIKTKKLLKIYILFDKFGKVSKENYKLLYKTEEDYDYFLNEFKTMIDKNPNAILSHIWYLVASLLSIYMYISYKNNPQFIENIKLLNDKLNELTVKESLQILQLNTNDNYLCSENLDKISKAFRQYIDDIPEFIKAK